MKIPLKLSILSFIPLLLLIFILTILEMSARVGWFKWNGNTDNIEVEHQENQLHKKYQLLTDWSWRKSSNYEQQDTEKEKLLVESDFYEALANGYFVVKKDFIGRHKSTRIVNREVVFDRIYEFDDNRRRKTSFHPANVDRHLIVFGCSNVFGYGLDEIDTLPSQIQKRLKRDYVFNLARSGGSIVDAIVTFDETKAWQQIRPSAGGVLFFFSYQLHMERFVGRMRNIGSWNKDGAFLRKNKESGEYEYGGIFSKNQKIWTILSLMISQSAFLEEISFDWPPLDENLLEDYVRAIHQLQSKYKARYGSKNYFVVYLNPGESLNRLIIPFLEKYKIFYLNYADFRLQDYANSDLFLKYDGHPSPEYNRLLSEQLVFDLHRNGFLTP